MEIIAIAFLITWTALYYVEKSARKKGGFARYAWLARAMRHLLFFTCTGLFLIIVGTDWDNRPWEVATGTALILVGLGLAARTCIRRKRIQKGLETGKIGPVSGEG